ncbi:Oidioi.mRNA.OKI2018_I69.PAR.g9144.t1.cds [Oikopleura dioica]|uniref:Oidioi.mRNA.OKI2018_I69.PAR.g9144.t1.cds n=1 Tax=Oikopleura dioica TaxID=34765 RepID=A0ABN7RNE4_OIKDI|nr:Oidioi.mRNA.OKI2018_I69.PAR.g9144.t1.cds [Oikopleura dioica]
MRLAAIFAAPALGQNYFYSDYGLFGSSNNGAKFGSTYTSAENTKQAQGNGKFCHSTADKLIYRWDRSKYGYFSYYNRVECVGEEFYCFIEERAHFGQVYGIKAGCAQMMNHPQVKRPTTPALQQWNNREAGRGRGFKNSGDSDTLNVFYGVGGCMAMSAQNQQDHLDSSVDTFNNNNYHKQFDWYQAQCLRLETNADNSKQKDLLPFGVSVCRACCIAGADVETDYSANNKNPCNFLPYASSGEPAIPTYGNFDCFVNANQTTACVTNTAVDDCLICNKEIVPSLEMISYSSTAPVSLFTAAANHACATSPCTPAVNKVRGRDI